MIVINIPMTMIAKPNNKTESPHVSLPLKKLIKKPRADTPNPTVATLKLL